MTYSIVARDPATGDLGVGVQSRSFRTGAAVPWAQTGIGAVATQSFTLKSYGRDGLALLAEGQEPESVLAELTAADELSDARQVAIVDTAGRTAVFTGESCIAAAGSVAGDGFTAQGNMLRSEAVVEALATGFERAEGTLAERLLAGLDAAEEAGGDFRGREAGAILVVPASGASDERVSDLRVDNHPDPLGELRRLLRLEQALRRLRRAAPDELDDELARARADGVDDDVAHWLAAVSLLPADPEAAAQRIQPLVDSDERWRDAFSVLEDVASRADG